jgi:GNAT superfamily N-acetyltransferase
VLVSGEYGLIGLGVAGHRIRAMEDTPRDAAALRRLMDAHAIAMGAEPLTDEAHGRLRHECVHGETRALFAESADGAIVGICTYLFMYNTFKAAPALWWEDGYVEEGYRDAGIGHAMHAELRRRAEDAGCCEIRLQFQSWNDGVRRLHARHGAVKVEGRELWKIAL